MDLEEGFVELLRSFRVPRSEASLLFRAILYQQWKWGG